VPQFHSQQQAKEYLVSRIVSEAIREGAPLTEIERKMLYFSETDWAPPGILDVNAEFERDYDDEAYEAKIANLVRGLDSQQTSEPREQWHEAVMKLSEGDHYLLVLIDAGSRGTPSAKIPKWLAPWLPILNNEAPRKPGDRKRLVIAALIIALLLIGLGAIRSHFE
jgi:hypothetical protein